jgi:hypothetical protein
LLQSRCRRRGCPGNNQKRWVLGDAKDTAQKPAEQQCSRDAYRRIKEACFAGLDDLAQIHAKTEHDNSRL